MKRIFLIVILISFLFLTCEDNIETPDPTLSVQPTSIDVETDAGTLPSINISCNNSWTVSANVNWLSLSANSGSGNGSFTASYTENTQTAIRSGKVIVTSKELTKEITINQAAAVISTTKATVTTLSATNIGAEGSSITGNITNLGGSNIIEHGHCWSTSPDATNSLTTKTTKGSKDVTGEFTSSLTGLQQNTKYYVRAYATNIEGTSYSQEVNFITISGTAIVTVSTPTNIDFQTITANGNITNLGSANPTQHGFVWSKTSSSPTISDNDGMKELGIISSTGTFSSPIVDLIAATDYNIRAFVTNSFGTTYSDPGTFKTKVSFTDSRDGQTYQVVQIGNQIWMAENLAYLDAIIIGDGARVYDYSGNIVEEAKATNNYQVYGVLYNQARASQMCPSGWSLPSENDWNIIINELGGSNIAGGKMKETGTTYWTSPNTGATNSSGFTALPGGQLNINGYEDIRTYAFFWSSTHYGGYGGTGYAVNLKNSLTGIGQAEDYEEYKSFSVRCIKD